MSPLINLRRFIQLLRSQNEIIDIHTQIDPTLELPEIHRRIIAGEGPALFFHNVKGSKYPVVTNLFGSKKRINLAFHNKPEVFVAELVSLLTKKFPPTLKTLWEERHTLKKLIKVGTRRSKNAPVLEARMAETDLTQLPFTKSWPMDGGHFITLPLVYTEPVDKEGAPNLGMYRIQRHCKKTTGLHWQIAKGGGFHYHKAEQLNKSLPVSIFVGGPPALILSAIAPLPENVPELMLCSLLQGEKVNTSTVKGHPHPILSECEFALLGHAKPQKRKIEGPFGDHYGYYSLDHEFPVFECEHIYHRKDAIFPATVVGKPRQEDFYIGDYLQELLSPLFPVVMPSIKDIWSYGETGFHSLAAAVTKERFYRESMVSAFRILGEGQLSLTKFLILTDQSINVKDIKTVLKTVLERFKPETDLFIFSNLSLDTLDYSGPELNKGSRGVLLGLGEPVRTLPEKFSGSLPNPVKNAVAFCPGCLVIDSPKYTEFQDYSLISQHKDFQNWPLIILTDDVKKATENTSAFLWTTFTRFEPAADIHAQETTVFRHHLCYKGPIVIDARSKPQYPAEVECDPETESLVTKRWDSYFKK
jgi:UbiD family decarboxylase